MDGVLIMPMRRKRVFDPFKDFVLIGTVAVNQFVLGRLFAAGQSVGDLMAAAKVHPGAVSTALGNGGTSHLGIEKFKMLTGTQIHIPYKGAGPALTDAIGGQDQVVVSWTPLAIAPTSRRAKLKALAVTGMTRSSGLPQVPTFAEAGLPAFDDQAWRRVRTGRHA